MSLTIKRRDFVKRSHVQIECSCGSRVTWRGAVEDADACPFGNAVSLVEFMRLAHRECGGDA